MTRSTTLTVAMRVLFGAVLLVGLTTAVAPVQAADGPTTDDASTSDPVDPPTGWCVITPDGLECNYERSSSGTVQTAEPTDPPTGWCVVTPGGVECDYDAAAAQPSGAAASDPVDPPTGWCVITPDGIECNYE